MDGLFQVVNTQTHITKPRLKSPSACLLSLLFLSSRSLRACQQEFEPGVVLQLVKEIGSVVALVDREFVFVTRTWCIFELYAAVAGGAELICLLEYAGGARYVVQQALEATPVNSKAANSHNLQDKKLIDGYIAELGGFEAFDNAVTDALMRSNDNIYDESTGKVVRLRDSGRADWKTCKDTEESYQKGRILTYRAMNQTVPMPGVREGSSGWRQHVELNSPPYAFYCEVDDSGIHYDLAQCRQPGKVVLSSAEMAELNSWPAFNVNDCAMM